MTTEITHILLKRGNTAQSLAYTGPLGEVTVDTDLHSLRVHDGVTPGGTLVSSGTGPANTGNWSFLNNAIHNLAGGEISNGNPSHGYTAGIILPTNGDAAAIVLNNTYGNVILQSGANSEVTASWTFGSAGVLKMPDANNEAYAGGGIDFTFEGYNQNRIRNHNSDLYLQSVEDNPPGNDVYGKGAVLTQLTVGNDVSIHTNMQGNIDLGNAWTFGQDGSLLFPDGARLFDDDDGINLGGYQAEFTDKVIQLVTNNTGGTEHVWRFDETGVLKIPGAITGWQAPVTIKTSADTINYFSWDFGTDGTLTLPPTNTITAALSQQVGTIVYGIEAWNWHSGTGDPYAWNLFNPVFDSLYNIGPDIIGWSFYSISNPLDAVTITSYSDRSLGFSSDLGSGPYAAQSPDYVSFHGNPVVIQTQGPQFQAEWTFGSDGNLTVPTNTTIKNTSGDINITSPSGFVNITSFNETFTFDDAPHQGRFIMPVGGLITGKDNSKVTIQTAGTYGWDFGADGHVTFPDGSIQTTAFTGLADNNIWIETFASDAPGIDFVQSATSVEYDLAGNIIALFSHIVPSNSNETYTSVAKLSPTGEVLWRVRFGGNLNTDGWGLAYDVVYNYIYIAGSTGGFGIYKFATLTKLSSLDGSLVWSKTYDFEADSQSSVVDVGQAGDPVMVGYAFNGTDDYIVTTRINRTDGSVVWCNTINGQGYDQAYGMAVGPDSEVVTIGYVDKLLPTDSVATAVTEPTSNVNWTTPHTNALTNGVNFDIDISDGVPTIIINTDDTGGRVVGDTFATILGSTLGGQDGVDDMIVKVDTLAVNDEADRMVVIKYASDGVIAWQKAVQFEVGYNCTGADADIDTNGNIYVCGQYSFDIGNGNTDSAMNLIKFDSAGVKQWSRRVVGNCETFATSVVLGDDGYLYLSGITGNNNTSDFIWVVAKYDTDGVVVWQRLIDNTTTWTFGGGFWFGSYGGGSNIAVRNGYIVLAGAFADPFINPQATAVVLQLDTDATPFSVGDWDIKGATFSGVLNDTASDITVVDAGKVIGTVGPSVGVLTSGADFSNFLTVTRYSLAGGSSSSIDNSAYSVSVATNGVVTMVTSRGSLEFGALPEPGAQSHFHIMKASGDTADLFLGDDFNYVLQRGPAYGQAPGYGVEIGTNDNNSGSQHSWRFGTDGTTFFPDGTNFGNINGSGTIGFAANVGSSFTIGTIGGSWEFGTDGTTLFPDNTVLTPNTSLTVQTKLPATYGPFNNSYFESGNGSVNGVNMSGYAGYFGINTVNVNNDGTYSVSDYPPSIQNGTNPTYTISGIDLGGTSPANDCLLTVTTVDDVITNVSVSGTALLPKWTFGTDGALTLPGNLILSNSSSLQSGTHFVGGLATGVVIDSCDAFGTGVWRVFVSSDTYPTFGTTAQVGDSLGGNFDSQGYIYAIITEIAQDTQTHKWIFIIDTNFFTPWVNNGYAGILDVGGQRTTEWTFNNDTSLTLPRGEIITGVKVTHWDTAYGWGDHSQAGYVTSGDRIVNGAFDVHIQTDGSLVLPNGDAGSQYQGTIQSLNESSVVDLDVQTGSDELGGIRLSTWNTKPVDIVTNKNSSGGNLWRFGGDGELTLPTGGHLGATKGGTMLDGGNGYDTSLTTFYASGNYAACVTGFAADGRLIITTYNDGGDNPSKQWIFGTYGNLTLPGGPSIISSTDQLSITSNAAINTGIALSSVLNSEYVVIQANSNNWMFGSTGTLIVPPVYPKSYTMIVPQVTGTGDSHWNITVTDNLTPVTLTMADGGAGNTAADALVIKGSQFGGIDGTDDISITVDTTSYGSWGGILSNHTVNTSPLPTIKIPTIQNNANTSICSGTPTSQVGSTKTIATDSNEGTGAGTPNEVDIPWDGTIINTYPAGSTITFQNGDVRTITSIAQGNVGLYLNISYSGTATASSPEFPITLKTANYAAATTAPEWTFGTNGHLTFPDSTVQTTASFTPVTLIARAPGTQAIPNAQSAVQVTWSSTDVDSAGGLVDNVYTVPATGYYQVNITIETGAAWTSGFVSMIDSAGGPAALFSVHNGPSPSYQISASTLLHLTLGQALSVYLTQISGQVCYPGTDSTRWTMHRVS